MYTRKGRVYKLIIKLKCQIEKKKKKTKFVIYWERNIYLFKVKEGMKSAKQNISYKKLL